MIDNIHLLELSQEALAALLEAAKKLLTPYKLQVSILAADPVLVHACAIQAQTAMITNAHEIMDITQELLKPYVNNRMMFIMALPYNAAPPKGEMRNPLEK